jgi:hypothetical protein
MNASDTQVGKSDKKKKRIMDRQQRQKGSDQHNASLYQNK